MVLTIKLNNGDNNKKKCIKIYYDCYYAQISTRAKNYNLMKNVSIGYQ